MTSGKANALQAIGAYMCAYSDAVYELGETLKVLFKIENNAMADAIVAALGDFARQGDLARVFCKDARNVDGTELSKERKKQIDSVILGCFTCNEDRKKIAHGRLEPRDDGSVAIVHVKVAGGKVKGKDPIIWDPTDWSDNTKKLTKLADELRNFQKELKTITIPIPAESTLGWLTRWDVSPALLASVAGTPPDEPKK